MDITSYLLGKKAGGGSPTPPSLQEKNVTITENTTTNVLPDIGYDGLSKVSVTTNVAGGIVEPKTLSDVNNVIHNFDLYLTSLLNNYEAYTNEAITIYTPNSLCTNFMIQKRTGNKYRIVWANDMGRFLLLTSNTSQRFTYNEVNSATYSFNDMSIYLSNNAYINVNAYYSNEFSSLEELINNLKSSTGNITYTSWTTSSSFTGILDDEWKTPITNIPVFENDYNTPVINGKVLSHNLTILAKE